MYPNVEQIVLVMDNLNTHVRGSRYKRFALEEARCFSKKIDIHYTTKHGSWLNMAEIELNVLTRWCPNRCIESIEKMKRKIQVWKNKQNKNSTPIHWLFTKEKVRKKLVFYTQTCLSGNSLTYERIFTREHQ